MRFFKMGSFAIASTLAVLMFSPPVFSDDDDDDDEISNPLFSNKHDLAKFIGISSEDFWENDDDDDDEVSARQCSRRNNNTPSKLLNCISLDAVRGHQRAMQDIADAFDGTRVADGPGYAASADYVRDQLLAAGYEVTLQEFSFPVYRELGPSTLEQIAPIPSVYEEFVAYDLMSFTSAGDVTGKVATVDLDLGLGNNSTSGCEASDFADFPRGNIAVVQRGGCSFNLKAENAAAADAIGIIIFNQGNAPDRLGVVNGRLASTYAGGIPAVGASYALGLELVELSAIQETSIRLVADVDSRMAPTVNVIAESKRGNSDNVVMLGGHLDSVREGPGINDNGSGSAALLETALQLKKHRPENKLRFAWWSAEEAGLLGSTFYVNQLSDAEAGSIKAYLNFDMVGSPNFARFIYDGDGSEFGLVGPPGSSAIEEYFELFYSVQGLASQGTEFSGRSDYGPFLARGVAAGGLFTGAEGIKTVEEQAIYGGTAGDQYDPCYHQACDTFDNFDAGVLTQNTESIALGALLFSYTTAPIDAQQTPAPASFARALSATTAVDRFDNLEYQGNELVR